jgi:hypothetical protein
MKLFAAFPKPLAFVQSEVTEGKTIDGSGHSLIIYVQMYMNFPSTENPSAIKTLHG